MLLFSALWTLIVYFPVANWVWGGGWLYEQGFADFAGSGIVCITGGFAGLCGSFLLGPRIGRFDEDLDYKNTKKKLQMLTKERATKKTKFGKKYRQLDKKSRQSKGKTIGSAVKD